MPFRHWYRDGAVRKSGDPDRGGRRPLVTLSTGSYWGTLCRHDDLPKIRVGARCVPQATRTHLDRPGEYSDTVLDFDLPNLRRREHDRNQRDRQRRTELATPADHPQNQAAFGWPFLLLSRSHGRVCRGTTGTVGGAGWRWSARD